MSQVGRKHRSSSCCSFPCTPRVPLLASPWGDLSYPGGKLSKRNLSMLSSTPLFFLLPAGNTFCSSGGGGGGSWLFLCPHPAGPWPGGSVCVILDPIIKSMWLSYQGELFLISNTHVVLASTCYPLFSSQFVQSSDGSRKAIHWVPPKTLNRPWAIGGTSFIKPGTEPLATQGNNNLGFEK